MKNTLLLYCMAVLISSVTLSAYAMMDDDQARADVTIMLGEGNTATEVISALVADGRELVDACVLATGAVEDKRRMEFVSTCINSSTSTAQAQSVADALISAAGENTSLATAITQVMNTYSTETLPPPATYQGDGIATGGGLIASPS